MLLHEKTIHVLCVNSLIFATSEDSVFMHLFICLSAIVPKLKMIKKEHLSLIEVY